MDIWQDGAKGAKVAALLQSGHLLEVTVSSSGGRALGHVMLQIVAVHPVDTSGVALEVMPCGVSNMRLQAWTSAVFTNTDSPVIHICSGKGTCRFSAGSRAVLHVQRWRLRNPLSVKEPWFVRPVSVVTPAQGSPVLEQRKHHHGDQEGTAACGPGHGAVGEEVALLHRFEQMRDGLAVGAEPTPGEKEMGKKEVQEALPKRSLLLNGKLRVRSFSIERQM
eukprot:1154109-Amphidinium_carterae.1